MINPKILILPDIHGRKFYQRALCKAVDKGAEIVCLGDYLDPYPGDDLHEHGVFAPLQELVEVKKLHPERVHLLIVNHDSSHMARRTFCGNLYKRVKDPDVFASMCGHKEGSKAFARYRVIDVSR